jgi:hypothetical protein
MSYDSKAPKRKYVLSGKYATGDGGKRKKRADKPRTPDAFAIKTGKPGLVFYSNKMDKDLTAIASHYHKKITTKRVLVIIDSHLDTGITTKKITQVTIL